MQIEVMKNKLTETHKEYKERKLKERKKIARLKRKKMLSEKKRWTAGPRTWTDTSLVAKAIYIPFFPWQFFKNVKKLKERKGEKKSVEDRG